MDSTTTMRSTKRKKENVITEDGWRKIEVDDVQMEGFDDGCAYDLEELTDYRLEKMESGGHMLVINTDKKICSATTTPNASGQPKTKKRRRKKQQPSTTNMHPDMVIVEQNNKIDGITSKLKNPAVHNEESQKTVISSSLTPTQISRDLSKWARYNLHPLLLDSLHRAGFFSPTPIQEQTIPPALRDHRDIVGAAPTGSGKTLAFGLPILSQLLREKDQKQYQKICQGLILTPTRELALQIHKHLERMVPNREIGVVSIVGGMSVQRQMRMLTYAPEIVIATPGRLWDVIEQNPPHLAGLSKTLKFLVIDEADRMLQKGAYPQVEKIFDWLRKSGPRSGRHNQLKSELTNLSDTEHDNDDEIDDSDGEDEKTTQNVVKRAGGGVVQTMMLDDVLRQHQAMQDKVNDDKSAVELLDTPSRTVRQTFLFSATLTIPEGGRFHKSSMTKKHHALNVLETVMKRVGVRGHPAVVDMSLQSKTGVERENVINTLPDGLELCQHEVTDSTRDAYLYYFLTQYPGKTIVFLNAIHQVRKLASLLSLLQLPVFALHAEMQQRQRLKKLDGFCTHPHGILIATDVAARGLDIPKVDYVVHYHIARSTEVFVHRSGRTARANEVGLSLSLVAPVDVKSHSQICKLLQRPTGLAAFPFDHRFLPVIDARLRLAKAINEHNDTKGKVQSEAMWFTQMAEAADLEMDGDLVQEMQLKKNKSEESRMKHGESVESMRCELLRLLKEPLRPIGSIRKFRHLHQELGAQVTNEGEYQKRKATDDLENKSKQSYKRFRRKKK